MSKITINEIAGRYLQHLARFPKINTRKDYEKRLSMLLAWCSMERIDVLEEIDFLQFLDWLFYDRGVSPRTRNNYRTWLRSFTSWARQQHLIEGNPMDGIAPMREPGKIRQPLPAVTLRRIKEYLVLHDRYFLLAVMLEYYTFIRPGELSELRIGGIAIMREISAEHGAHHAPGLTTDTSGVIPMTNYTTRYGGTYSVPVAYAEMVDWFNQW